MCKLEAVVIPVKAGVQLKYSWIPDNNAFILDSLAQLVVNPSPISYADAQDAAKAAIYGMTKILLFCIIFMSYYSSFALTLLQDQEIEDVLSKIANPVIVASGLPKSEIKLYLIEDSRFNAFTTAGYDIFISSGALTFSDDPALVQAVIAHELGHMKGGHVAKMHSKINNYTLSSITTLILGAGAIAAGAGDVGMGTIMLGQELNQRSVLKFSRNHESIADQSAIQFLEKSGSSAHGLLKVMEALHSDSGFDYGVDQYLSTHPLNSDRVHHIKTVTEKHSQVKLPVEAYAPQYRMAVAKLNGFLSGMTSGPTHNPYTKDTKEFLYFNAAYNFQKHNMSQAKESINKLLNIELQNPYFLELKGQIEFADKNILGAISAFKEAIQVYPRAYLIKKQYALLLISYKNSAVPINEIIKLLEECYGAFPDDIYLIHMLGITYGKANKLPESYYYLALEALENGDEVKAKQFIERGKKLLKGQNTPIARKYADLEFNIEEL